MSWIPYGRQDITESDIEAVVHVLRSDFVTQGPVVDQFEQAIADYCGVGHAVAVNSATSALHIACLALNLGEGGLVWTTPNTFVATANCARYCGADVGFVDIDAATYNLCPVELERQLQSTVEKGEKLPDIVIAVHFAGQSCDMQSIDRLAKQYGFLVIEDASHAIGGYYKGKPIGNCEYSDIAVFSFHPVKIITCGEGGVAVTRSPESARRMQRLRSHGIDRPAKVADVEDAEPWVYYQNELGFNYRLTDIQAALGLSQLSRLDDYVSKRHELARRYDRLLNSENLILPFQSPDACSSMHLYPIQVLENADAGIDRRSTFNQLLNDGIGINVHYIPVHTQPYYQALGNKKGEYPVAEAYYSRAISLPLFGVMTFEEQDRVVESLASILYPKTIAS